MRRTKPAASSTVRVTATDVQSGKSKTTTVYEATPEEVIEAVDKIAAEGDATEEPDARHRRSA